MKERRIEPEFSRVVDAAAVGDEGFELTFDAHAAERQALAERLGLLALERLDGVARFERAAGGRVRAKVTFEADVLQSCVVTLEPVAARISDAFEASFAESADLGDEPEVDVAFDEEDPPEPIRGGRMELGELVTQHLSLALDPYPRKPGVQFEAPVEDDAEEAGERPFAALAKLASKRRR